VCSKSGISEKILIEESSNTDNSKKEIAITIVRQLRPYLLYLEDKIDIYHEQFKKAISFKYFTNDSFKINQHRRLSKHYHGLGDDLAWHLAESGDLDNLAGLLSGTLYDFGAYWVKNPEAVKEFWRQIGKIKNIDIVHAYSRHINMSESDIFSAINRENLFHIHFNFLSDLFRELGYVEESIKIHKICIRIHGKMGDPTIIDDLLNEARMHIHEHKHDEALSALLRVEPLIREKNIPFLWCAFYNSKANLYIDEGMLSEAVVELDKTYLFSNDSTCSLEIAYTLHLRATTLKIQNRYEEALSLEKQSEVILNNSNASLTNNYVYQAELHFRLGNFKEAVSHFEKAEERLQNGTNFQLLQYVLHCKAVALIKENDLNAAFYNLLEEEDLCRENKLTQELLFCLWEQAVLSSNTDRQDFDRAFDKLIEHKKILSEFNFEDKENLINENNKLMAIVLFNQAIVIWNQLSSFLSREDFRNRCISKMNEAISIAKDVKNFDANELKRMIEFTGAI
jgi:tetratricopeptide (TPR) repeat protein